MSDGSDSGDDGGIPTWAIVLLVVVVAIPVVLMVTVMLAAVIGAFVLGFGGGAGPAAPAADWTATDDPDRDAVTFEHVGGDSVEREHVAVTVNGEQTADWEASGARLSDGDTVVVHGVEGGDDVELFWDTGDSREVLAIHDV